MPRNRQQRDSGEVAPRPRWGGVVWLGFGYIFRQI